MSGRDQQANGVSMSAFVCEAGERFCGQNTLAMWHRLRLRPAPVIQETPSGFIVILGPFETRKEALWWAWKGMESIENE